MSKEISRFIVLGMLFGGAYLIGKWALGILMLFTGIALAKNWHKKYIKKKKY